MCTLDGYEIAGPQVKRGIPNCAFLGGSAGKNPQYDAFAHTGNVIQFQANPLDFKAALEIGYQSRHKIHINGCRVRYDEVSLSDRSVLTNSVVRAINRVSFSAKCKSVLQQLFPFLAGAWFEVGGKQYNGLDFIKVSLDTSTSPVADIEIRLATSFAQLARFDSESHIGEKLSCIDKDSQMQALC